VASVLHAPEHQVSPWMGVGFTLRILRNSFYSNHEQVELDLNPIKERKTIPSLLCLVKAKMIEQHPR